MDIIEGKDFLRLLKVWKQCIYARFAITQATDFFRIK